jgi:RND family efflux transporter MFP subunit
MQAPEVPTITAQTARVTRSDLVDRLLVRGTITTVPNEDVKLSALVAGRVTALAVAEGDTVRKGQVVAEIDPRPFQDQRRQAAAAVDQAVAAEESARSNLQRTERLFERGIAARKEVEDAQVQIASARAAVEQARAALDTADRQLERTRVVSPLAGQVVRRLTSVGEQVDGTAAQPIVEIANLERVELAANVPSEQLARVRAGQPVEVVSDAYAGRVFAGHVTAIAPAVDPATNAALVRIGVEHAQGALKVGMFAEARVALEEHRGALTVPPAALVRDESGTAVYRVNGEMAERTPVKVGIETPEAAEILLGLAEGDTVLVSSVYGLGQRARLAKPS